MNLRSIPLETSDKITQLENEIKVLKNEVQAVLLDIRENVLNAENPFNNQRNNATSSQIIIDRQIQTNAPQPAAEVKAAAAPAPAAAAAIPAPAPAAAPAPAPAQAAPAQEQKPPQAARPSETRGNENYEPGYKGNGRKAMEQTEMEHKHNGKRYAETAHEDTNPMEDFEMERPRFELCASRTTKGQPDLVAYAGLACWVEDATKRLGKERTQAILEISEVAGFLPPEMKVILTKLTTIKSNDNTYKPSVRDYFDSLAKIAALFGNNSDYNAALLLLLAQGDARG
jgi:hypothetical protein